MTADRIDPARDDLDHILDLVAEERRLANAPGWKVADHEVIEAHGAACDALWKELYRLLDMRDPAFMGRRVRTQEDLRRSVQTALARQLKESLPQLIEEAIDAL